MISIFIPTYNGEKYLAKTLEYLLAMVCFLHYNFMDIWL